MSEQPKVVAGLSCVIDGAEHGGDIVFLHGWGCDGRFFEKQRRHFADGRRVLIPDFPGHGRSAAREQPKVPALTDAVGRLLREIGSEGATIVGHSMGGNVALDMRDRYPDLVRRLVLIDTVLWPSGEVRAGIETINDLLSGSRFDEALTAAEAALLLPSDDPVASSLFRDSYSRADRTTLVESFRSHLIDYELPSAKTVAAMPLAYIGAEFPMTPFEKLIAYYPGIRLGKTIGSGHFSPLLVPTQINAMIDGFLDVAA